MFIARGLMAGVFAATLILGCTGCGLFDSDDDDELEMFRAKGGKNGGNGGEFDHKGAEFGRNGRNGPGDWNSKGPNDSSLIFGKSRIPGLVFEPVYFRFDKSRIESDQTGKLEAVASYLSSHAGTGVIIEGNCDDVGSDEYNRGLGERRALAAKDYLLEKGITEDRICTVSYGEEKPAAPNDSEAGRAKNRRDEFVGVYLK